ncbi:hypothetical protein CYMTET_51898 [Cymbomonas tetramitiformis]|uniref:J domain-containing protein n=1 Tax=Cymbomonas tetramitiformis TaxID=36881 RepID=A0AAE0BKC1_9CHLO|nr:hypothetical protein CYMTET_51898 [Cymbomonas tetramitiformis]
MFGGLRPGSALRAKALAKMQEEQRKKQEGPAPVSSTQSGPFRMGEAGVNTLPQYRPITPADFKEVQAKAREEEVQRLRNRAAASQRQVERRKAAAEERRRQEQENPVPSSEMGDGQSGRAEPDGGVEGAPSVSARSGHNSGALVTFHVQWRGLAKPAPIILTGEEYETYTVVGLKQRVARESGISVHATQGRLMLWDGLNEEAQKMLQDKDLIKACLKDGAFLMVRVPEKENYRPQSAPMGTMGARVKDGQHLLRMEQDALWRGSKLKEAPKNMSELSTSQLEQFILQAGEKMDDSWEPEEMMAKANACVAEWEVQRVLNSNTHFEVLRLPSSTRAPADIKAAYRKLSLSVHPDKNSSDDSEVAMAKVTQAFQGLMKGETR